MRAKHLSAVLIPTVLAVVAGASSPASADRSSFRAKLLGANENPIVLSDGEGRFVAQARNDEVAYRLSYEGLEDVLQAHIHVGHPWENGGVTVFLCTNLDNAPAPACPEEGSVTGTFGADDVRGVDPIPAGDLEALVQLMSDGATYVNVHTDAFEDGEIRGQVNARRR